MVQLWTYGSRKDCKYYKITKTRRMRMKKSEIMKTVLNIAQTRYAIYGNSDNIYICNMLDEVNYPNATIKERLKKYIGTSPNFSNNVRTYSSHITSLVGKRVPPHFVNFLRIKLIEELIKRFEEEGD